MLGPFRSFKIPMNIPAWRSMTAQWRYGRRRTRSGRTASLRISEEETSPKESNHGGWSKCPRNRDELATSLGSARRILIMGTIVELQDIANRTASLRISEEKTSSKESNHRGWSICHRNHDELAKSLGSACRILIMGTIVELQGIANLANIHH